MIRLLVFLAVLAAFALGFSWLADHPGEASLVWLGERVETDTTTLFLGLVALVVAVMIVVALVRALWGLPGSVFSFFGRRRRDKGWAALSRGMIAVGAGDVGTATRASADARHLLGDEPLALLLEAQQAQLLGDRGSARRAFETMLEMPETKLLGLRGLYVEAVRWGDGVEAARYADLAHRAAPRLAWAGAALLDAKSRDRDWQGALETIDANRRHGVLDKRQARRLRAVVLTADALERESTRPEIVRGTILEAVGLAPDLVPAVCLAARLCAQNGDLRKATRLLEAAWKLAPHPDLAATAARLRPGEGARDRLTRVRDLIRVRANHPEGALALARAEIDAQDFAAARAALAPLVAAGPTRRVCELMADVEDKSGGTPGAVRTWLTRALHAPRDPAWVADGFVSERWAPYSPVSGRIDAFEWKIPPEDLRAVTLADPIDEADDVYEASGALVPMETVRAPAPVPDVAAAVVVEAKAGAAEERSVDVGATTRRAAATVVELQSHHLPDDPGPREEGAEVAAEKTRFRLFS